MMAATVFTPSDGDEISIGLTTMRCTIKRGKMRLVVIAREEGVKVHWDKKGKKTLDPQAEKV